jgi:hypothetical protein
MSLTDIRSGLQTYLQTTLGYRMVAGIIEGPVEDENLGCVWTTGGQRADDAESELVTVHVRIFLQWKQDEPTLRDPAALEALVDSVGAALKPIQSGLAGAWFFGIPEWEIDLETNGAEFVVTCRRSDPFALGG